MIRRESEDATDFYTGKTGGKKWSKKQQGRRLKKPTVPCFKCGKVVHYAQDRRSSLEPRDTGYEQSNVAFTASEELTSDSWVMDSGASAHMCKDRSAFEEYYEVQHSRNILSAKSNAKLKVMETGVVKLRVSTGRRCIDARLENSLHAQD